jgi:hypothetical protein
MTKKLIFLILFGLMISCASAEKDRTQNTEQMLSAAGFKPLLADTEARMAHLASLPQHKVVPQEHKGKLFYIYADETVCNCLFIGDQAAYQQYSQMAVQNRQIQEQEQSSEMEEDAEANMAMDWEMWGGLYPWD